MHATSPDTEPLVSQVTTPTTRMPTGEWRAESRIARILAPIVVVHAAVATVELAVRWRSMALPLAVATAPLLLLSYGVWLWTRTRQPRCRAVDAVVLLVLVATGAFTEAVCQPGWMTVSMENVGFTVTVAALYASPRAHPRVGVAVLGVGMLGHLVAARAHPIEAWQGAVLGVAIWIGTQLVARELRRAGCDADTWRRLTQEAERIEAQARVHDAQGLLRAVRSTGGDHLSGAVEATRRRNARWFAAATGRRGLVDAVVDAVAATPDLDITVAVDGFQLAAGRVDGRPPLPVDVGTIDAVGRAVHTLLGNVREHARHAHVTITGDRTGEGWSLEVADDGPGFDPASTPRHHGLTRFTEESLTPLGIRVDIRSGVGQGTVVRFHAKSDREGIVDPVPTRFAAWRRRPTGGSARAEWIVDLARAALVLTLFVSLAAATAAGGGASRSYPLASVAVSWTVSLLLVGSWWVRRQPATVPATVISLSGVVVGAAVSAVAASGATVGSKIGLFVANWSCMYLASVRPDWSWRIVPLGVVQGVVLGLSDPSGGVITSMWVITGVLVTADLVRTWQEFGAEADADRARALLAERHRAAELLRRQIRAMHLAGSPAAEGLVAEVSREVSAFLRTPPASSRASDPRSFPPAPGVEATDAARRVVEALSSMPGVSVDMRTTPEADTACSWRISLLATGLPPRQPLPALDAPAGCAWRTTSLPGGVVRLVLAPLPAAG